LFKEKQVLSQARKKHLQVSNWGPRRDGEEKRPLKEGGKRRKGGLGLYSICRGPSCEKGLRRISSEKGTEGEDPKGGPNVAS